MMNTLLITAGVSGGIFGVMGYLLGRQGVVGVIKDFTNLFSSVQTDVQAIKAQVTPPVADVPTLVVHA